MLIITLFIILDVFLYLYVLFDYRVIHLFVYIISLCFVLRQEKILFTLICILLNYLFFISQLLIVYLFNLVFANFSIYLKFYIAMLFSCGIIYYQLLLCTHRKTFPYMVYHLQLRKGHLTIV